jgi:hypothetical protein
VADLNLAQREELKRQVARLRQIADEFQPLAPTIASRVRSVASDAEIVAFMADRKAAAP